MIDGGNVQFIAIFAYLGQYKRKKEEIMEELDIIDESEAKMILNERIRKREIFIGMPTYTFMNMLTGYLNKLKVTLDDIIVMALDYGSWRKDVDKTYKAQRKDYRESFEEAKWWQGQFDEFNNLYEKLNKALPFTWIKIWKCEADDVISVACRYFSDKEIIIVSSDKDLEMLLTFPNVKIFSVISKKFKDVPNPTKVLLDKIQQDISDNLLEKPSTEAEFEKRKVIVDLINPLPIYIEQPIRKQLSKIIPKNIFIHKIPYHSIRLKFQKIYNIK